MVWLDNIAFFGSHSADLSTEKDAKLPTQPERRERALVELIRKRDKPIVLFIDDAHDLHNQTLLGLKRLIELVRRRGGRLSVVLAGHPKLKNDLRRPDTCHDPHLSTYPPSSSLEPVTESRSIVGICYVFNKKVLLRFRTVSHDY
jgi:hypothetical protein